MSHLLHYPSRSCSLSDFAQTACIRSNDAESYAQIHSTINCHIID